MTIVLGADAAVNGRLPDGVLLISFAAGNWHLIYEGLSYRRRSGPHRGGLYLHLPTGLLGRGGQGSPFPYPAKSLGLASTSSLWVCA